jgi:GNAT superfamily N-acetyltransferase
LIPISFDAYKSFVLKHPRDLRWFYWSIKKDRGMVFLEVVQNSVRVGVVGVVSGDSSGCEILIDDAYRRKGIGEQVVGLLIQKYDNAKFKVSKYNRVSLDFFRSLGLKETQVGQFFEFTPI